MNRNNFINSKLLALACLIFLVFVLTACGGGGGGVAGGPIPAPPPVADPCDSASVLENGVCHPFAIRLDERMPTPFVEDGQPVSLEVVVFKPLPIAAAGTSGPETTARAADTGTRYPTLVFHHGSTGDGSDPSLFGLTFTSKTVAQFFVERGWIVAFPQRRGRGSSDGLYDEGFNPGRSAYSCQADLALGGAEHALEDLDAITDWLRNRADVDTTRTLVGGTSRGGILSVVHVARRPDVYRAAINFVGGWLGEGCGDYRAVNRTLFEQGAGFPGPTLWLYGANDSFYSLPYSRSNFGAYTVAGGLGIFEEFERAPGRNGHFLINDPALWEAVMDDLLGGF